MRFIDNRPLLAPDGWQERADAARDAVIYHGEDVNSYGVVWRELKDALAELSHDKCWYCEMRQERSDNAVDHFRPKAVYRWLAFNLRNFHYACTFCNSRRTDAGTGSTGGKGDQFPLEAGCARAAGPGEEAQERFLLLNPCCASDPMLLDFNDDGRPTARHPDHPGRRLRAETSILLYHLNHSDLVEHRRRLAIELNEKIEAANALYDRVDAGDPAITSSYAHHVRDLVNAMAERAELSAFARRIVAGRRDIPWVEALFQI
jgi:uncharacterized protein (TIGR02646 family)